MVKATEVVSRKKGWGYHLCTLPQSHYGSSVLPKKEIIYSFEVPIFAAVTREHLQIAWSGGQQGLQLWSRRIVYICILYKPMPSNQPETRY